MAAIDRQEVLRIAQLAMFELDEAELERMTAELGSIIAYVEQLQAVDVEDVPPTFHVQLDRMPFRADEPAPSLERDTVLAQAPEANADGFTVPAFVDEG